MFKIIKTIVTGYPDSIQFNVETRIIQTPLQSARFSNYKLAVQFELGLQRLVQLGYSNVHIVAHEFMVNL